MTKKSGGVFRLPVDHEPALRVPKGGSSCANCKFYVPQAGTYGHCVEPNYIAWAGSTALPCPADEFCSDWYVPTRRLRSCR